MGTFAFITASPFYWMYQTKLRAQPQPFHAGAFLRKYYPRTLVSNAPFCCAVLIGE